MKLSFLAASLALGVTALSTHAETINFTNKFTTQADSLVVFASEDQQSTQFKEFDALTKGQLSKAIAANKFEGKFGQKVEIIAPANLDYQRVVIVGLGQQTKLDTAAVTRLGGQLSAKLNQDTIETIHIAADNLTTASNTSFGAQLAHGINLRAYKFEQYHSKKRTLKTYAIDTETADIDKSAYQKLVNLEKAVFFARDLTNETASAMTPAMFAKEAMKLKKLGVEVKVLEPKQLKKLGMGALEAVGRGSKEGSRLIIAHYKGSDDAPIALVGKGITFDSGGYSLKTGASIARMKSDMAGAAAVLATVKALALNKSDKNVVAVMGMAANMVSEHSIAPGDVVTTAEGLTVEVVNTDAEGRLVLSDAMWYAREYFKPAIMVDVATLTGSKVRALGNEYAAIFSEDDQLVEQLTYAGKQVNENLWRLPLGYKDALKTDIADLKNIGSYGPGATTAASFLQHFSGDVRWVHLDIAGNALASKAKDEVPTGGTGFGVRLLNEWIESKAK
ncbi:leucyl aminopeptidase [Pseudoalteromonas ulvae]|uniref:Probable cytosol aminopeptidase n=1 Tax=Pseudoalteromonas ulvae TaxID=107327 RepID=A0A244CT05_PSEDV|nr:leucyl aminopeptidase [Pseudoalteromonas ulvae]OUL58747.1 leucyl aminopeptidase [Pseudoalteromonas ulvae]